MIKLIRRLLSTSGTVEFCESCAQVCTGQCRANALFDRARTRALQSSRF